MKAALCKSLDGPEAIAIEEVAEPVAAPGEAVIPVKAAALNFFDTLITRGKYQSKPELPFSPSGEIAGIVAGVGPGVPGVLVGTRVVAYLGWGGAREKVAVDAASLIPIPDGVSDERAAGVSITYGTALHAFADRARLAPGERVAVLGAAGGAGLAAVAIAKLMGAWVIAVASSPQKLEVCRAHGADALVDYRAIDLKHALCKLSDGRGVDVVYDCVGGAATEAALRAMAWQGRLLVVGFASGEIPKIALNLLILKGCEAVGVFWGEFVARNPEAHRANMRQVLAWVEAGRLEIPVHRTFALGSIVEALKVIDRREAVGKIIITP